MPEDALLASTYARLSSIQGIQIEPFEIVAAVERYRSFWKPDQVRIILLVESYVYTSPTDFGCKIKPALFTSLGLSDYAQNFVRFVYCMGYGEDDLLLESVVKNSGTPQFWKIFYSCLHPIRTNEDFSPILKRATDFKERMVNKVRLLQDLKASGVWFLDASIMALYRRESRLSRSGEEQIIATCWNGYIRNLIVENRPQAIICIGKGVASTLSGPLSRLSRETGIKTYVIPQPQAHLTASEHIANFQNYYRFCQNR